MPRPKLWWALGIVGATATASALVSLSACGSKAPAPFANAAASAPPASDDGGDGDATGDDTIDDGGASFSAIDAAAPRPDAKAPDAGVADAGEGLCTLGAAGNFATQANLSLFGNTVYYNGGAPLPAGRYRLQYLDGCMKYNSAQGWACNQGSNGFFLVDGDASTDHVVPCPCVSSSFVPNAGFYDTFDACVAASKQTAPTEFNFDGGPLGIVLTDSPYSDNVAGQDGRNPKWSLTLLGKCPPDVVEVPIPTVN